MLSRLPLFVVLVWVAALAMLAPALMALMAEEFRAARAFFFGTLLYSIVAGLIALAMGGRRSANPLRGQLIALFAVYSVLPVMLALPFYLSLPRVGFLNAWFEMISAITTTGATIFDSPGQLPQYLHLWRALVGWLGGLLIWIAAVAVFAPLVIGGFEVRSSANAGVRFAQEGATADPGDRLARFAARLAPIYVFLTASLWVGLMIAGEDPFVALCHAMAVLATSGISPVDGVAGADAGFLGEGLILIFFVFAISRLTFSRGLTGEDKEPLWRDPEIRFAMVLIIVVPAILFARHWIGGAGLGNLEGGFVDGLAALWGTLFTVVSFLTTTGFESRAWGGVADWSGLTTPGLLLLGLAIIGGGIATTAGGVKLLRIYALYLHGRREVERLVHPSSVGGRGPEVRRIRREGAQIAWVFFMLFAMSIALVMVLLALTGVQFEVAMVLTVSALSNTGPLAEVAAEVPIYYAGIPDVAKMILAAAMVLGRLEALAIIALLNPEFWRK